MRVRFNEIFNVSPNGITPKVQVQIGGITMGPGVTFGHGAVFAGIELAKHTNQDLEVEQQGGVYIIKGVYNF